MEHVKKVRLRSTKRILVGGAAGLLAFGVGGGSAFAAGASSPMMAKPAVSTPAPGAMSSYATSVTLQAMPAGTVHFAHADGKLTATISAFGLTPGSIHLAEITSPALPAPITFGQFTASATGQVSTTVSSLGPVGRLPGTAVFQIELTTSPGDPIAVADVGSFVKARTVSLVSVETSAPARLAGHASLNYDPKAHTLTVRVDATGFVPNTDHAAHVHSGSCEEQGGVVVMLQDLHADAQGRIAQTDVVQNVASFTPSSGLYLNIHEGDSATILDAAGNPTPQFRPLLCANLPASGATVLGHGAQTNGGHTDAQVTRGDANDHGKNGARHKTEHQGSARGKGKHTVTPVPVTGKDGGGNQGSNPSQGGTSANGTNPTPGTNPGADTSPTSGSGSSATSPGTGTPNLSQIEQEAQALGQQVDALEQTLSQPGQDTTANASQLAQFQTQAQQLQSDLSALQSSDSQAQLQADSQQLSQATDEVNTVLQSIGQAQSTLAGQNSSGTDPTQSATPPASDQATQPSDQATQPSDSATQPSASDPTTQPSDPATQPSASDPQPAPAPPVDDGGGDGGDGGD